MNCPRCQTDCEQTAQFCRNCGTSLSYDVKSPYENNRTDVLVFISVAYWFVVVLVNFLIQKLIVNWYTSPFKFVQILTYIPFAAIPILIALSIRNKELKTIAIILATIICMFILYSNIEWLIRELK